MTLILASLTAGIFLMWFDDSPSIDPKNPSRAEERSQLEPGEPRQPSDPGDRASNAQITANGPESKAVQENSFSPADISASKPPKPARINDDASIFPDYEEPEEPEETGENVIGGYVQDEDGNPLSYIEVVAERIDDSVGVTLDVDLTVENVKSIFTDNHGAFLFSNLDDDEYRVRLAPVEGIAPAQTTVRVGTLNVNLVVVVLRNIRVYGTVISSDGPPIKDVHIIAGPTARITSTGSRGEYELDISLQGKHVVHNIIFQHKDFRPQRIRISQADLGDLTRDFQLDVSMEPIKKLATVTGSLTDTDGIPVGGETLHILTSQMQTKYRSQSDTGGYFLFENIEPGKDYQLAIRPGSGYKNKDINPLVIPDGGLNLDIILEPAEHGELSGWMIDPNGNPIPGFSLTLHSTIATGQSVSVTSNQQGFFFVEGFPVGGALFRTNSYPAIMVQGLHVSPEPEDPVTIVLDMGRHVLQGSVINEFGEPVAAASITLDWEFRDKTLLNSSSRITTTDQNGIFVFTDLGSDLHKMQVSAAGFSIAVLTINIGIDPNEIVVELEEEAD